MSEQDVNSALSRVSISTGVIPFPSMDSSLLPQNLSALEEASNSTSPERILRPSASSSTLPGTLPFPTTLPISDNGSTSSRPEPVRNDSTQHSVAGESHITSSSRLTSSDKLSALPSSTSPNVARPTWSSTFTALTNNKRGFRRSLDAASTPVPFSSKSDPDSRVFGHNIWGTTPSFNTRSETNINNGILERHPTPETTPKQRVSFDSDRSLPTMHSVGQAFSRITRGSDPQTTSRPSVEEHRDLNSSLNVQDLSSPSHSPPPRHSRATSPLRMLQQWSSGLLGHRTPVEEEPFVPVDPFKLHYEFPFCCFPHTHIHDLETGEGSVNSGAHDCDDLIPTKSVRTFFKNTQFFIVDTLPRQVYLNFLLYLPAMYFSRVARIFEDAEVSKQEIERMIACGGTGPGMISTRAGNGVLPTTGTWEPNILAHSTPAHIPMSTFTPPTQGVRSTGAVSGSPRGVTAPGPLPFLDEWTPPFVSPALIRFKHSWEAFIDSLMREWKTLNVISALLASTILNIFQITEALDDPVTRTAALLSLICALMSLIYGCMYIVKFGMMRNMFHASRWAEEAQKMKTSILWNVWVLLAMPVVWMSWAMILFLSAILSFVWRTGSVSDPTDRPPLGDRAALGPRIAITSVLILGLGYMAMIIMTLKKYGSQPGSTRTSPTFGTGNRNAMRGLGGGTPAVGNTIQDHEAAAGKKFRARDIDAAMERRGRQREKSTSTTRIRRREEDVERRQQGRQSAVVGDKGGRNSTKGMHGLGLGSDIELKKFPKVETDD